MLFPYFSLWVRAKKPLSPVGVALILAGAMTWRDVFRRYLHERDWTQSRLARESRTPASNLSEIMTGKRKPTFRHLERIADALGVSVSELVAAQEREEGSEDGEGQARPRVAGDRGAPSRPRVPVLSRCPAGPPQTWYEMDCAVDAPDACDELEGDAPALYALRVVGDSMNPWMWDGDLAIVDPGQAESVRNGDVIVARVEGVTEEHTIKRVRFESHYVVLIPDNPRYESMEYPGARVHIQGLVVRVLHSVNQGRRYDEDLLEFLQRPEVRTFLRSMLAMPPPMWEVLQLVLARTGEIPKTGPQIYAYLSRVLSEAINEMGKRFVEGVQRGS